MSFLKIFYIKAFIAQAFMFVAMNASAQNLRGDTLVLANQDRFWLSEELTFGNGTMPDGSFNYIYEAPSGLQKLVRDHKKKLLMPHYKGYKSRVVKFEKEIGRSKKDDRYNILVLETADGNRYWCDASNAVANHEILLKAPEKSVTQTNTNSSNKETTKPAVTKHTKTTSAKKPVDVF